MKSTTWFILCELSLISTLAEAQPNTPAIARCQTAYAIHTIAQPRRRV